MSKRRILFFKDIVYKWGYNRRERGISFYLGWYVLRIDLIKRLKR